jgi:hypothetical protein
MRKKVETQNAMFTILIRKVLFDEHVFHYNGKFIVHAMDIKIDIAAFNWSPFIFPYKQLFINYNERKSYLYKCHKIIIF